ncbi:MAG: YggS family pyridoxal phosphate-dependent enzyme [Anaerolineales bacterium]|nr:YggS family pyridoxal phosphate-dependent enzyme [Anaerolineales bacterium]
MENEQAESIRRNIESVLEKIHNSAKTAGRDPDRIALIAVTKLKPALIVKNLAEFGIVRIGESYLKEALFKMNLLNELEIEWHMIGTIQQGKEKEISANFAEVHSVDSKKTAINLNKYASLNGRKLPVYLEFNVSGEKNKHGWGAWADDQWNGLLPEMNEILDLPNLDVKGLMTMAPYSNDPQNARPYFKRLRKLQAYLTGEISTSNLADLSMGMSGDFEVAIEEGATVLRIGSALVGPR